MSDDPLIRRLGAMGLADPAWLFLLAGLTLIGFAVLIPADRALAEARWQRDRALAVEAHAAERADRFAEAVEALDRRDPVYVAHLRAMLDPSEASAAADALVRHGTPTPLTGLEPRRAEVAPLAEVDSLLARLVTGSGTRLWVIAAAALCLLLGVMPTGDSLDPPAEPAAG